MAILTRFPAFTPDPHKSVEENLQAFMHACAEHNGVPRDPEKSTVWFQHHVVQIRKNYSEKIGDLELSDPIAHTAQAAKAYVNQVLA